MRRCGLRPLAQTVRVGSTGSASNPFLATDDTRWTVEGPNEMVWNATGRKHRFKTAAWGRADGLTQEGTPNAFGVMGYDANAVAPGRRMLSSMTPSFMLGKDRIAVLGTPGGSRIITMVLIGMLGVDQGLDPQQVTALPRFHHQYLPDTIYYEPGAISADAVKALEAMGHTLSQGKGTWGNLQAADWNLGTGGLRGGSDPRTDVGKAQVVPAKTKR